MRSALTCIGRIDDDRWTAQSTLLILLYAATSPDARLPLEAIANALRQLGWRLHAGPVEAHHLYHVEVLAILRNVGAVPEGIGHDAHICREAAALARAALK